MKNLKVFICKLITIQMKHWIKIKEVEKLMSQATKIIDSMTGFSSVVNVDVEED